MSRKNRNRPRANAGNVVEAVPVGESAKEGTSGTIPFTPIELVVFDFGEDSVNRLKVKNYADRIVSVLDRLIAWKMRGLTCSEAATYFQIPHHTKTEVRCLLDNGYYPIVEPVSGKLVVSGVTDEECFQAALAELESKVEREPLRIKWRPRDMLIAV